MMTVKRKLLLSYLITLALIVASVIWRHSFGLLLLYLALFSRPILNPVPRPYKYAGSSLAEAACVTSILAFGVGLAIIHFVYKIDLETLNRYWLFALNVFFIAVWILVITQEISGAKMADKKNKSCKVGS